MVRPFAFVVLSFSLVLFGLDAAAQPPGTAGTGRLSANASGTPVPPGAAIELTPSDADNLYGSEPLYAAARAALKEGLRARGFRTDGHAALRLRLDVSTVQYGRAARAPGPVEPLSPPGPRPQGQVVDQFRVPFAAPENGAPPSLTVALVLYEANGAVLWSATVRATGRFPEPERTVASLARAALGAFGNSAERAFEIGCRGGGADSLCQE